MDVSRTELFELVWSEPRSSLAKRFGISDVALAKRCRQANIPMPERGYWAKVSIDQRPRRPALPLRLPGQSDVVTFEQGQVHKAEHSPGEAELIPPSFEHTVDELVDAAIRQIGRIRAQRNLTDAHSGLARILAKDDQRQLKFEQSKWSFDEPKHRDPASQRELRLYSALFRAFDVLGVKGSISEDQQWEQGVGTTYGLTAHLSFPDTYVPFRFLRDVKNSARPTLVVRVDSKSDAFEWTDSEGSPLEKQLGAIARGLLVFAEQQLRRNAQHRYEWQLRMRQQRAREEQERRHAEEAARQAQVAMEQKKRREALYSVV